MGFFHRLLNNPDLRSGVVIAFIIKLTIFIGFTLTYDTHSILDPLARLFMIIGIADLSIYAWTSLLWFVLIPTFFVILVMDNRIARKHTLIRMIIYTFFFYLLFNIFSVRYAVSNMDVGIM